MRVGRRTNALERSQPAMNLRVILAGGARARHNHAPAEPSRIYTVYSVITSYYSYGMDVGMSSECFDLYRRQIYQVEKLLEQRLESVLAKKNDTLPMVSNS